MGRLVPEECIHGDQCRARTVSLSGRADVGTSSSFGQGGSAATAGNPSDAGELGGATAQGTRTQAGVGNNVAVNPSTANNRSESHASQVHNAADGWSGVIGMAVGAASLIMWA